MNFKAIIARQREFFQSGATRAPEFRRAQLLKLAELLESHEAKLLAALHADLRKSAHDAYASEIGFVHGEIRYALRHLASWMKPQRRRSPMLGWPASSYIHPQPYGLALIIGAWNYPLQLLLSPLVGAIAAGNCAILKPSEFAPQTAEALEQMIRSGYPEAYLTIIQGERETADMLLREKFDSIFFTGGTATGRDVMAAAARHLTPVTLELGGKCPCIVCHDAPVETTARRIVWGKFMNAGQTCVAPDHVWVDQRIAAELLEEMKKVLAEFYGEHPQQSPDYGRIVNPRHLARLAEYLKQGSIVCGGECDPADLYLAPTILTDVQWTSPVMTEEIFGPVLPVIEFGDIGGVLAKLRDQPKPLALYLFTRDGALQERVLAETQSGGVCINDTILHILGHDLPFGGVGESGMGQYHGRASFDGFSHRRVVMRRPFALDSGSRYPPPGLSFAGFKRLLRFLG
ncbi:MAG: aldehyde dehydrogenase [Verrucomicrobia bacterium]|nr:MAG: aldehyde dehydrogenase [Verrucomicrobiota bacterium]